MTHKLYWLAFKVGGNYRLCPYLAESRQDALRHGMEYVLDWQLVTVFSDEDCFNFEEMLELATVMPRPGSVFWRQEG